MEENYIVAVDGVIVPNVYELLINPLDLTSLTAQHASLATQLEQWLREVAREEHYRFAGPLQVRLVSSVSVPRRSIEVQAAIVETGSDDGPLTPEVNSRDYRVVPTQAAGRTVCRVKILTGPQAGQVYIVNGTTTALGRAIENDIVLESADVSRHHARLEAIGATYRLIDLGSTNGTRVNGRRTSEQMLAPGDTITLGATDIVFQLSDEPEMPPGKRP